MGKFHNIVIFDVETGGISKENIHAIQHPITQIALLGIDGFELKEIARYQSYIKGRVQNDLYIGYSTIHDQTYQQQALDHTNITVEKLEKEGQDAKKVCLEICDFFEKCKSGSNFHKIILAGHNVTYDIPFLQYLFKLYKKDLSKYLQGFWDDYGNFQPTYLDTMILSRLKSIDEGSKHNLGDTAIREGFELLDGHQAMVDVSITKEILVKYLNTIRNGGSSESQIQEKYRDSFSFEY